VHSEARNDQACPGHRDQQSGCTPSREAQSKPAHDGGEIGAPGSTTAIVPGRPCILLDQVRLRFRTERGDVEALSEISLSIAEGEFIALLGPTGCGKSSLLRLVSDLLPPTSGTVAVRGAPAAVARRANEFGFVFQEPALLSWRTALGNVHLPLEVVNYPSERRIERCRELLDSVDLLRFKDAYPHELSGGMKQRVAIVRALACNPSILLMDEPFSALDELTRAQLQDDLLRLWSRERKTILFVTHNISEAIYLADRVVVMSAHPGRVKTVLTLDLPRPRNEGMHETAQFLAWVRLAREALRS
jgi:NitT/TauT family transport system ATP-binding protein